MRNEGTAKKGKRDEICSVDCSVLLKYGCIYVGRRKGRGQGSRSMPSLVGHALQCGAACECSAGLHVKAARARAK